jgi:thioredoxin-related protein
METGTFPDETVRELMNKYFIPLKYESGKDAEQFLRFGIRATPTFVFLDSKGDEIHRIIGYFSTDDFIKQLESARSSAGRL